MKLIIQLPCFNEVESLPITLSCLPRSVEGFDMVEWLVIDDGSTDGTADVARSLGVDYVISHAGNLGLAKAFMTGIRAALASGADVIVNTDADNQYNADDIPMLTRPIIARQAEMVIGARPISSMPRFTPFNRLLHAIGCLVVRKASGTDVPDAPSGFRAFSREAAQRLNVYDSYTYTLETIIQAGCSQIPLVSVPVRVNNEIRPSRLISSNTSYVLWSALTIIRTFALYRPFHFYGVCGVVLLTAGQLSFPLFRGGRHLLTIAGSACLLVPFAVNKTQRRRRIRKDMKLHGTARL